MIEGLYEAHLPVRNLEASMCFYEKLGLKLAWKDDTTAFYWLEEGKSWLGLWEGEEYKTIYHPSLRHIAFRTSYENMKNSVQLLEKLEITPRRFGKHQTADPFIRPFQCNASVYFNDPDGNSLELMCFIDVPEELRQMEEWLSFEQYERLVGKV